MQFETRRDSLGNAESFIDFLAQLSLDDWLLCGEASAHSIAAEILDATVAAQQLQLDAWFVRDSVETLVFLARCSAPPRSPQANRALARARAAAERAAIAILARRWLAQSDFDELVLPFSVHWGAAREPRRAA